MMMNIKTILGSSVVSMALLGTAGISAFAHDHAQPLTLANHQDSSSTTSMDVTYLGNQRQLSQMRRNRTPGANNGEHMNQQMMEQMEQMMERCNGMMNMMMERGNMNRMRQN